MSRRTNLHTVGFDGDETGRLGSAARNEWRGQLWGFTYVCSVDDMMMDENSSGMAGMEETLTSGATMTGAVLLLPLSEKNCNGEDQGKEGLWPKTAIETAKIQAAASKRRIQCRTPPLEVPVEALAEEGLVPLVPLGEAPAPKPLKVFSYRGTRKAGLTSARWISGFAMVTLVVCWIQGRALCSFLMMIEGERRDGKTRVQRQT